MHTVSLPPGVFNLARLRPRLGRRVHHHHLGIAAITFTGESRTGSAIMKAAAGGETDLGARRQERGIVFADCDFDRAVDGLVRELPQHRPGCLCSERVLVERPIYERFVEALARKARALVLAGRARRARRWAR